MDRPPTWEGEPVNEADVAEIHAEAAPTDPSPKRPAAPALPTGPEPAPKKQKFYDFRTGSWTEAPPRMQIPSRRADALGKLRKNMCELCGQKSKNYGLRGGSKQWCGPCGKLRGGTLHCMYAGGVTLAGCAPPASEERPTAPRKSPTKLVSQPLATTERYAPAKTNELKKTKKNEATAKSRAGE
jgi:hypothetical protein